MKKWFTLMLIIFAARAGAYTIPYEMWMGTFVGEKKIGWMSLNIAPIPPGKIPGGTPIPPGILPGGVGAEHEGVTGYKVTTVVNNHLMVLGADLTQIVESIVYTD